MDIPPAFSAATASPTEMPPQAGSGMKFPLVVLACKRLILIRLSRISTPAAALMGRLSGSIFFGRPVSGITPPLFVVSVLRCLILGKTGLFKIRRIRETTLGRSLIVKDRRVVLAVRSITDFSGLAMMSLHLRTSL
jgi:hypothetical protein